MGTVAKKVIAPVTTLTTIAPKDLADWWPLVAHGLHEVHSRVNPTWVPEDVYVSLRRGGATLSVCHRNDQYVGFVVTVLAIDPFNCARNLMIWAAYSQNPSALNDALQQIEHEAKVLGYESIVFQSPRRGWERRLRSRGFRVRELVFEKRL